VRFAATRHAGDDLGRDLGDEVSGGDVIEERKRRSAVYQDVVDGVIDEIFADGVVDPGGSGNQHLRPNTIGGHDEHRLLVTIRHADHAAEPTDLAARERRACGSHQLGDPPLRFFSGIELDAGGGVFAHSSPSREKCNQVPEGFTRRGTSVA